MNVFKSKSNSFQKINIWLDRAIAVGLLMFLGLLPFHLVIKQIMPDPLGTYWKEILLGVSIFFWILRCILNRKLLVSATVLNWPVLVYLGVVFLHLFIDHSGSTALWGFYISILYLPLFWLLPQVFERFPRVIDWLILGIVTIGTIVSLGGILEFIFDKSFWPSAELISRQGFPDVFIYGTHLRRVYFVFDSPTTLANTLAMILPLTVIFFFLSKKIWKKILGASAIVLILLAILFTFSRGIWVALGFTAIVITLIKVLSDHKVKFLLKALSAGVICVGIIIVTWLISPITESNTSQKSIELLPSAYNSLPLGAQSISLLDISPKDSKLEKQIWTIFDPIDQRNDQREVAYMHPLSTELMKLSYGITVPENGIFRFSIALSPEVWTTEKGDGVDFKIYIREEGSENGEFVFSRYINPKSNPSDRRWRNYALDLSTWSGKNVELVLITEAGPNSDYGYDWAGWANLDLGSVSQEYFVENETKQDPFLAHVVSITDWAADESNRDRIAAWNSAFAAWGQNPIWGNGLGTTGTAALRTIPQQAIVTESQPLKALVELGIPGLFVWAYLWFMVLWISIRLYRRESVLEKKILFLGILASLLVTFIDGFVYQNLEVKQVNAFFWMLVAILAYFEQMSISSQAKGENNR